MKKGFILLSIIGIWVSSCGQSSKEYYFPSIGLRIEVPTYYIIQDSFPRPKFLDSKGNEIRDSVNISDMDSDLWKGLLVISSPDHNNTLSLNLAAETRKTGNLEQYFAFSKYMQLQMASQRMLEFDTSYSKLKINGIDLHKFLTFTTKESPTKYSGIYLANVKNYFLVIKSDGIDSAFIVDMERAILSAKFE